MGPSFTNNPSEFNLMASPSPQPGMEIQPPALLDEDPSTYSSAMWDWVIALRVTPIKLPSHPFLLRWLRRNLRPIVSFSWWIWLWLGTRLLCSSFVEGLLPCSYPELDQKLEEAERLKKKRDPRLWSWYIISELKGANASFVLLYRFFFFLWDLIMNFRTGFDSWTVIVN